MSLALPLAHHNAIAALPVFVPALIVGIVVLVHYLRSRGEWDEEEGEDESPPAT